LKQTKNVWMARCGAGATSAAVQGRGLDENGVTIAMRVAGIDRPRMLEQWFRRRAQNLEEFKTALRIGRSPVECELCRRRRTHHAGINGLVPSADRGLLIPKVVPGNTSKLCGPLSPLTICRSPSTRRRIQSECQ
jgi:hypothetical protein